MCIDRVTGGTARSTTVSRVDDLAFFELEGETLTAGQLAFLVALRSRLNDRLRPYCGELTEDSLLIVLDVDAPDTALVSVGLELRRGSSGETGSASTIAHFRPAEQSMASWWRVPRRSWPLRERHCWSGLPIARSSGTSGCIEARSMRTAIYSRIRANGCRRCTAEIGRHVGRRGA